MNLKLNPSSTKYDPGNACSMANFSSIAYTQNRNGEPMPDKILRELNAIENSFEEIAGFSANSSQGLVIKHAECIVVAFRGTDEIADWLDNINALAVDHALGRVHEDHAVGDYLLAIEVWGEKMPEGGF